MAKRGKAALNDKMIERVKKITDVGAPAKRIYQYMGISGECFYKWKRRGEEIHKTKAPEERTAVEQRYATFYQLVSFCRLERYRECVEIILTAAKNKNYGGSWTAAAWWLERTFHEEFATKVPFDAQQVEKWLKNNYGRKVADRVLTILEERDAESEMETNPRKTETTNETSDNTGESTLETRVSAPPGSSLKPPGEVSP